MSFFRRLVWLFRRGQRAADLDAELRFHLEEEASGRRAAGIGEDQARREARLDFGNPAIVAENTRAAWGWTTWEQLIQDLRYAGRTMAKSWLFSALAVSSLALGIGANTVLYSFTDSILVRALPVPDSASLVRMTWRAPQSEYHGTSYHDSDYTDPTAGFTGGTFSSPAFELFRARADLFSVVFAYQSTGPISVSIRDQAEPAAGEYVSADYFRGLGVTPAAGRFLRDTDDRAGAPLAAVVDFSFAVNRFGAASDAIGQEILVSNTPFTIVGVAPPGFYGTDPGVTPDVYVALHANVVLDADDPYSPPAARYTDSGETWLEVMARLKPGIDLAHAEAAASPQFHEFSQAVRASGRWDQVQALALLPGAQGIDGLRRGYGRPLFLLTGLAGVILVLACANIANLLLARAAARTREIAVRMSLGASRARIVRQLLTESILLSSLGGALAVGLACWGERVVTALLSNGQARFTLHAELNWRVLLFAWALSIVTGILFGLAPAVQATRRGSLRQIESTRAKSSAYAGRRSKSRRALVTAQIASTMVMLVSAGLFARTIGNLNAIDLGFNREGLLTVTVDARQAGLKGDAAVTFYRDLRDRLAAAPGVMNVGLSDFALVGDGRSMTTVVASGHAPSRGTLVIGAGAGLFQAMQIPLVMGRAIDERDDRPGAPPVAVVSEGFAKAVFGGATPLGQSLKLPNDSRKVASLSFEIVGVARDVRIGDVNAKNQQVVYFPFPFAPSGEIRQMVYELRTAASPWSAAAAIREVVRQADSRVPIARLATQADLIDQTIGRQLLLAKLCGAFATLAFVIAIVGLYGTVLYDVSRRTAEIGVRMALGASAGRMLRMVLGDVLRLSLVGVAIGVPAARWASRFAESFLFGVTAHDPLTVVAAAAALLLAALAATYVPARTAARLNPTVALRCD